jgi:hypothetical protein
VIVGFSDEVGQLVGKQEDVTVTGSVGVYEKTSVGVSVSLVGKVVESVVSN